MADAEYDTILSEVAPYAPNCPEPAMVNAVRNAVIDFCSVTGWLTQDLSPITLAANTPTYEIEADDNYELVRVMDPLWLDGVPVRARTELELRRQFSFAWAEQTALRPVSFTQLSNNEIRVVPIPTASVASPLTGRIVVKPSRASTGVDERLLEHHAECIAAGALERILRVPDEAYTSPEKAIFYGRQYRAMRNKARIEVAMAYGEAQSRVFIPRSW